MKLKSLPSVAYFDRIRINSHMPKDFLAELVPLKELQKHCNNTKHRKAIVKNAGGYARQHGYNSTIEAFQATDQFLEILKLYDIGEHGIARIEIAKDYEFETVQEAEELKKYFKQHAVKAYTRRLRNFDYFAEWVYVEGQEKPHDTIYLGKKGRKGSGFYFVVYIPPKIKVSPKPTCHTEFVLIGKSNINNKLQINGIHGLGSAKEYYDLLEKKYLRLIDLKHDKIKRLLKQNGKENLTFEGVWDFREFLLKEQKQIRRKQHLTSITKSMLKRKGGFRTKRYKKVKDFQLSKYKTKILGINVLDYC